MANEASKKITGGRVNAVKCPYCGNANDFRGLQKDNLIDKHSEFDCDHCHHIFQIVNIETVTILSVRQHPEKFNVVAKQKPGDVRRAPAPPVGGPPARRR